MSPYTLIIVVEHVLIPVTITPVPQWPCDLDWMTPCTGILRWTA